MIELFWHSAVDSLSVVSAFISIAKHGSVYCIRFFEKSYRSKDSCPVPSHQCTDISWFVWISLLEFSQNWTPRIVSELWEAVDKLTGSALWIFETSHDFHKKNTHTHTERRTLYVQPLTSNVKQNRSAANPEAPLSSDHSNSVHLFCQTLSRQYRTNNCYIIPITQWQCVCFVSLNYFRYINNIFFCPLGKNNQDKWRHWDAHRKNSRTPTGHELTGPAALWIITTDIKYCSAFPLLFCTSVQAFKWSTAVCFFISSSCDINNRKIRWWK